jgi:hypothetical protein
MQVKWISLDDEGKRKTESIDCLRDPEEVKRERRMMR